MRQVALAACIPSRNRTSALFVNSEASVPALTHGISCRERRTSRHVPESPPTLPRWSRLCLRNREDSNLQGCYAHVLSRDAARHSRTVPYGPRRNSRSCVAFTLNVLAQHSPAYAWQGPERCPPRRIRTDNPRIRTPVLIQLSLKGLAAFHGLRAYEARNLQPPDTPVWLLHPATVFGSRKVAPSTLFSAGVGDRNRTRTSSLEERHATTTSHRQAGLLAPS